MDGQRASGTATVLFTDLVGSTASRARLGDEGAEVLRRVHDRLLFAAIGGKGGEVVKHLGDGVMATFVGAADALAAAVAAQQAIARHNRSAGGAERLEVRIGLSAGDVEFEDGDVFGTPVVEASRLCDSARGGQVLAAEVVRVLAGSRGGHRFTPVGALELKGFPDPVVAVEVGWALESGSTVPLPAALVRTGSFGFVGRDAEGEVIARLGKEVAAGERRVVLVSGEAGVGKTRLVAEAAARFHDEGTVVLFGRCEEELGVPYQPFAEALADYVAAAPPEDLAAQLGSLGGELSRLVPSLATQVPGLAPPLSAEPETERYRLFEAVRELLVAVAETAPVVLVLDDLHWAARPTLALLLHLVRRTDRGRLFIVGTYRDTDLGRTDPLADMLADLRRIPGAGRVALTGLDEAGVVALLETIVHHAVEGELLALMRAVWSETEGNPFFVGEVIRHLVESGAAAEVDGRWVVLRPLAEVGIPGGVREVVGRRLSRLSEQANEVLTTAAVIGREFDVGLLAEAIDGGAEAALDTVEQAEAVRLVVARRGRPGVYAFAHALVRSTLYEELPTVARLRLHRRIGLALERRVGAALPELARHFIEAAPLGEAVRAVDYARRAGDRSRDGLAFEEAASHYEQALAALDLVGDPDLAVRCDLQIALGNALNHARDRRYRTVLASAAETARRLGDGRRLAEAAIAHNLGFSRPIGQTDEAVVALADEALAALPPDDDPLRASLLAVQALELAWSPDMERRRTIVAEAEAMARRLGDRQVLIRVLALRPWAITDPDELAVRTTAAEELVALAEDLADAEAAALGHCAVAMCLYDAGDGARAVAHTEAAERWGDQVRNPVLQADIVGGKAVNALLLGQLDAARRLIEEHRDLGNEAGMPPRVVLARYVAPRCLYHFERGEPEEIDQTFALLDPYIGKTGTAFWLWRVIGFLGPLSTAPIDRAKASDALAEVCDAVPARLVRNVGW
ncbi:MAG: AAA family ATPase, partial [Actinobacteria bacterium]|nr:AAA family ATPase [Actinomycetota bacterium]